MLESVSVSVLSPAFVRVGSGTVVRCAEAGVVRDGGGDRDRLPSLLLSKITSAVFSYVGISGTFSTGVWCDGMLIVMCGAEVSGVVWVDVVGSQNLSAPAPTPFTRAHSRRRCRCWCWCSR